MLGSLANTPVSSNNNGMAIFYSQVNILLTFHRWLLLIKMNIALYCAYAHRLQRAVEIINELDSSKFPLLLNRITQTLQSGSPADNVFTKEEEEKLQTSLNLDHDNLQLLLECTSVIIEQAAYHMTKPVTFHRTLLETLGMNEDKAQTFVNSWSNTAKGIVDQLRKKSIFPAQLEDIRWSLRLQTSSSSQSRQAIPKAVLQFGIKENETINNVTVDFNHHELFELYKKIEKIQTHLDNLK